MKNNVMKMRHVKDGIDIPAGETTLLAPGGYHIMLIGLHAPLEVDNIYEMTFVFQHAGEKTIKGLAMLPSNLKIGYASKAPKDRHNH